MFKADWKRSIEFNYERDVYYRTIRNKRINVCYVVIEIGVLYKCSLFGVKQASGYEGLKIFWEASE